MNGAPVFCVVARDQGIAFLRKAFADIKRKLGSSLNVEMTSLLPNDVSRDICWKKIESLPDHSSVMIFIHGGMGYLTMSRDGARVAAGGMIDIPASVCKNKHMIIVSCNSDSLVERLKSNGALSAVGFGLIDFACEDLYYHEENIAVTRKPGKRPTRECFAKYLFRRALADTIIYCESRQLSAKDFVYFFHYFSNFYADKLLLSEEIDGRHINITRRKRILIAQFMQKMKESIICS